jgi:hypothetical protein
MKREIISWEGKKQSSKKMQVEQTNLLYKLNMDYFNLITIYI